MRRAVILGAMMAAAGPALAHPHVFIDAGFEVVFDTDGRATGLRIRWAYDELVSLSYITDRGLDPDFDGILTAEELTRLNGFDMGWHADFVGDSYALLGDAALALGRPADWTVGYDGGKVTSTHYRAFETPVNLGGADLGGADLVLQAYDPGYYTAYAVVEAKVTGRAGCEVALYEPDRAAADQILQDALAEYAGGDEAEAEFPAVGSAYAEEARVTCRAQG